MAERHAAVLGELTELGLDLARTLKAKAEAAESPEDAERLALAFHRIARSVRLTLALESRLARERTELADTERAAHRRAVSTRQDQVRTPISREIWAEREADEAEALETLLIDLLDEASLYPGFLDTPVEAQIAWLRAELRLPANDAAPALDLRRSSG